LRKSSLKLQSENVTCLPKRLDLNDLHSVYLHSEHGIAKRARRVFVFDYGGTLLQKEKFDIYIKHTLSAISGRKPSGNVTIYHLFLKITQFFVESVMESIHKLSEDPQNIVASIFIYQCLSINSPYITYADDYYWLNKDETWRCLQRHE
jgi:hypothetical protein